MAHAAPLVSISATCSQDALLRPIAQPRRAANFSLDRGFDVGARHDGTTGFASPIIRLGQYVVELVDDERQLVRVIGEPRGMLDQKRGSGAIDRLETIAPHQRGNQARMGGFAGRRTIDVVLEVRKHFEMLGDIRIEGRQEVIEHPVAEQHHFDIERNWVGFKRDSAGEADKAAQIFDPDLTAGAACASTPSS